MLVLFIHLVIKLYVVYIFIFSGIVLILHKIVISDWLCRFFHDFYRLWHGYQGNIKKPLVAMAI